jgi:hypothetical protein
VSSGFPAAGGGARPRGCVPRWAPRPTRGKTRLRRGPYDHRVRWGVPNGLRGSGSASGFADPAVANPRERGSERLQHVFRAFVARWPHCAHRGTHPRGRAVPVIARFRDAPCRVRCASEATWAGATDPLDRRADQCGFTAGGFTVCVRENLVQYKGLGPHVPSTSHKPAWRARVGRLAQCGQRATAWPAEALAEAGQF